MAPSQLKQLKASLRDHGVLGPQKSKKQRKATSKDAQKRNQRNAALESIRERFNPFEVKAPARKDKFEVASGRKAQPSLGRPGVTRGLGEERRRETLLKEMQSRNKVGGLLDRRFGENDPTMTPEQRAAERFARQNERKLRKTSMFNLEDDSEEEMALTHGGRSLDFGGQAQDDFDERDVAASDDDAAEFEGQNDRPRKKLRLEDSADTQVEEGVEEGDELPQRRKSKNEVMKEVIAKSKFYKAERQAAKADDDDLRAELNKGMSEFYEALRDHKPPEKQLPSPPVTEADPHMDPARAAMLAGKSRQDAEKEYEANLRALKLESRSKPSVRTKTEEEKAAEEAARLEELERKRMRRMKGEAESSDDDEDAELGPDEDLDFEEDDAEPFGLAAPEAAPSRELDVEDEDEFMLEDDLIASDSEAEVASEQGLEESESEDEAEDDGDDDFINGLVLPPGSKALHAKSANKALTHEELLALVKDTKFTDLPTIIQRIRALYHKGLAQGNQEKLDVFAVVLTQHVAYLADNNSDVPFSVLESLLRHLHSMAKASPQAVGDAFRRHLESIAEERPLKLSPGDLVILTGVSTIFPTSDHFHAVVTPAMLTLGRYLGQSSPQSLHDLGVGAYCCSLALLYQRLAKRYVPEVIAYVVDALAILAPASLPDADKDGQPLNIPLRLPQKSLRTKSAAEAPGKLSFKQLVIDADGQDDAAKSLALLNSFIRLFTQAAELWKQKSAFPELVSPLIQTISHIISHRGKLPKTSVALASNTLETLQSLQKASIESRRPLLLHNHRPLAIKTSIPAFIENYNPDRHYDPDRQRADLAKLKAEHKKERKGAMRELRKDANFMAREQLREKKEKDVAYDKKFKRLVAEIQGEEGREKKEYEREKRKRQGRF
ncbi:nucleolar complex protein 14 [Exophiala xenobiotica]|uniref:Nucleolar complex protein 14 n=1 Tax=Vermiconidia calcicola TaxID=1690605 RepID=A0AAV9QNM3_9PEZI|nr:nucleolar complex protein 14 [Exophiala xenobiotica]KAK5308200.1 nucleolar complex protein 14 [Exophiala xenobiotica]KAK5437699.1 nucleolar complex protein 14 [Exophiala xenobiotica]KAK5545735.1 nucleolar complex protein 14 [Vermiconidia calcicola]KAK5554502.1 nucleolar complex protein 14 [Exophiala xenobiotica]